MSRGFSNKTKISKHNLSYSIHPDKRIIKSMGWNLGQELEVIPIPKKGIICLKGKRTSDKNFTKRFYRESLKNINQKEIKKILNKIQSTIRKFDQLDILFYREAFKGLVNLEKQLKNILENWDKYIISEEEKIRKKLDIPFTS